MLYHTLNFISYTRTLLQYIMKLSFSYNTVTDFPFRNVQNFPVSLRTAAEKMWAAA